MTIENSELVDLMRKHDLWVQRNRPRWKMYRAAYETKFWEETNQFTSTFQDRTPAIDQESDLPIRVEINRVLPWVQSYITNLFYKGARTALVPDSVLREGQEVVNKDIKAAVAELCDRFLNDAAVQLQAAYGFQMALMYGAVAWKLGADDKVQSEHAVDAVWAEVIPPWECFWDRNESRIKNARYLGQVSWWQKEEVDRRGFIIPEGIKPNPRPDLVKMGERNVTELPQNAPSAYYRILELYDRTEVFEAESEEKAMGTRAYYLVSMEAQDFSHLHLLEKGPVPHTWPNGKPLIPIIPVVLENVPEHPLEAAPPVAPVYEMTAELNMAATVTANQYRRDAARVGWYDKNQLDEEALATLTSGRDSVVAGIETNPDQPPIRWVDPPRDANKQPRYESTLQQGLLEVQGTSPQSRGQQGAYLTATEAQVINDYDQSTFGLYRKRMDKAIARVCEAYLRVLMDSMKDRGEKTLRVRVGKEIVEVGEKALDRKWTVTIIDTANTPVAEQRRKTELLSIIGQFLELLGIIAPDNPQVLAEGAKVMLAEIVRLWDLPADLDPDVLLSDAEPTPEEEAEAEAAAAAEAEALAAAQGGQQQPIQEDELAAAEAALADPAIAAAVEQSLGPGVV